MNSEYIDHHDVKLDMEGNPELEMVEMDSEDRDIASFESNIKRTFSNNPAL